MVRIVKTEFYKLKRYHILWAGVALMLLAMIPQSTGISEPVLAVLRLLSLFLPS